MLQLRMYYDGSVSAPDVFPKLAVPNGWVQEIKHKPVPSEEQTGGKTYGVVTLKKYMVIPQKSGSLIVPAYPVTIKVTVPPKPDDFFQVEQTVDQPLTAPDFTLQIVPLPEPKPASFAGAVGKFAWQVMASIDSAGLQKPVQLTFRITGRGNLPFVSLPAGTLPAGLEGFDIKSIDDWQAAETGLTGNRSFTQTLVADQGGSYTLPFGFTYFDPQARRYVTLSDTVWLQIYDSHQNSSSQKASTPIPQPLSVTLRWHPKPSVLVRKTPFSGILYGFLCLLPMAGCVCAWLWVRWKKAQSQSPHRPYREAISALQKLKKQSGTLLSADNAQTAESILFRFFSQKCNLTAADWHTEHLRRLLAQQAVSGSVISDVLTALQQCQQLRFGSSRLVKNESVKIEVIIRALQQIEKHSHAPQKQLFAVSRVLLFLAILFCEPVYASLSDSLYVQAQQLYQTQQFDSAAVLLQNLAGKGYRDAALYHNLASSYFQSGKTGLAVLYYEKARWLAPDDLLIAANLNAIRQKKNLLPLTEPPWWPWISHINTHFLIWLSIALCWTGGVLLIRKILFLRHRLEKPGLFCLAAGIVMLLFVITLNALLENRDSCIITTTTAGYYAPSIQARKLVRLSEGTSAETQDYFEGWVKVRISDGRRVWVRQSTLKPIALLKPVASQE